MHKACILPIILWSGIVCAVVSGMTGSAKKKRFHADENKGESRRMQMGASMNNNYDQGAPKKNDNGWLIGVVSAIVVLMAAIVISAGWLGYRIVSKSLTMEKTVSGIKDGVNDSGDEFDFDFDYHYGYGEKEQEPHDYDDNDSYPYPYDDLYEDFYEEYYGDYFEEYFGEDYDDYGHDYDNDDRHDSADPYAETDKKYYEGLEDAVRSDLDYSVRWESYEYDTDYRYVDIYAVYPQITGENIPNLEHINDYIFQEIQFWVESFEEYEEEGYFYEDDSFELDAYGYVTYMDEEKISIVFSEHGMANGSGVAYLYSINVDVQNGVILDNSSIINMDDEFAVEFRNRNKEQNDADGYVDILSDQEIAEYLNSETMGIVFYTPLGLEVGINVDGGWYTVTYKDYEKYLKKL